MNNVKPQEKPKVVGNTASVSFGKCKLCPGTGHATSKCFVYKSLADRKQRALALGLCSRCLNNKHKTADCPGNKASLPYKCFSCGKSEHHGALCPQIFSDKPEKKIFNIQMGSDILVPVVTLRVSREKRSVRCSFLLDTGAQFSIINKELVDRRVGVCLSPPMSRRVSSFDEPVKNSKGFNYPADLTLPCGLKVYCIFFAMEKFRLNVRVPMLNTVVNNLEVAGYSVSPDFPRTEDIEIFGIIGNDILQYFSKFSLENISLFDKVNGRLIRLANGYIPFGSVINYIHPGEEKIFLTKVGEREFPWVENSPAISVSKCVHFDDDVIVEEAKTVVNKFSKLDTPFRERPEFFDNSDYSYSFNSKVFYNSNFDSKTLEKSDIKVKSKKSFNFTPPKTLGKQSSLVQFALDPVGYQFDPLQELFPDSNVEYGLDSFYKLESIGIKETDSPSYETEQLDLFKNSITYKDGHYNVRLPWKSDLVKFPLI